MKLESATIEELLLAQSYVGEADLDAARTAAAQNNTLVTDELVTMGVLSDDLLGQAIAEHYGVTYADINSNPPAKEVVLLMPEAIARKYNAVVFQDAEKSAVVATDDPSQEGFAEDLQTAFPDKKISIAYGLSTDIEQSLRYYRSALDTRFAKILEKEERVAPEIIEEIIGDAITFFASDIHFEPRAEIVVVRFRIDGAMQEAGRIPKQYYDNILNRIKVMAKLRIDEHFEAQDGAIRYEQGHEVVDMRVSVVPTIEGEKVVMRVLSSYVRGLTLDDLGFSAFHREQLDKSSKKPFGMILVTGPTGSGKTTTLYAVLKELNEPRLNVTTVEDPVEYKLHGVNQIQVNTETDLTFAKGLRAIVRQDPDVILVGEIRDRETAEIAVNAALTGHLLLSTFHANDAATAIPRLLDMGVEPFLLASTMEVIFAQRLIRTISEDARVSYTATPAEIKKRYPALAPYFKETTTLYRAQPSANSPTGFSGRTAIVEAIEITREMKELILNNPSTNEIWALARKQGSKTLFEDGIEKVKAGVTTIEELLRVASPPDL